MKSKYAKAIRTRFREKIVTVLPDAQEITTTLVLPQNWYVFEWKVRANITVFVELLFANLFERFHIRIVVSSGGFPDSAIPRGPDEWRNGIVCFSLEELWRDRPNMREWNVPTFNGAISNEDRARYADQSLPSKAMLTVIPAVDNAINRIREYLIPYVDRILAQSRD